MARDGSAIDMPSTLASLYLAGSGMLLRIKKVIAMAWWKERELRNRNLEVQGLVLKETGTRAWAGMIVRTIGKGLWLWVHQKLPPWGMIYVALGLGGS